jgi:hypothetical protein
VSRRPEETAVELNAADSFEDFEHERAMDQCNANIRESRRRRIERKP